MSTKEYAGTDQDAATALGISLSAFRAWKAGMDFTIRRTSKGWPLKALFDYALERKARDKRNVSGLNADLRRKKLSVEIELLEIERDKASGALAEVDVVVEHFSRLHSEFVTRMRTWKETWQAKQPEHHKVFEQVFDDLSAVLLETVGRPPL